MKVTRLNWAGIVLAFSVAGCSSGATGPPNVTSVDPVAQSALQFSVGTANIAGTSTGMNVVVTNRQGNGDSGVLLDTPKLSGAFALPASVSDSFAATGTANTGPSAGETSGSICGAPCIVGSPQVTVGSPPAFSTTFGTRGGVFGLGFAPANSDPTNAANIYVPYQVPLYGAKLFTPWGGPPAFDPTKDGKGTRDGTFADATRGILGVALGLSVFKGVTVNPGAYALSLAIPTTGSTGIVSSAFTLGAVTPIAGVPTVTSITFDGTGQATVAYTLPPGVTGAFVEVIDNGPSLCNAAGNLNLYGPATSGNPGATAVTKVSYYTFWVTASGTVTVLNANSPGPPGSKFPAFCTSTQNAASPLASGAPVGDSATAYVIGFDYDHYSLTYNKPLGSTYAQRPTLPAQADLTISTGVSATSL